MCNILKDQSLLYAFMQFLKDQGAVHVLNFCLDVDNFNKRMLNPELSTNDLELLHRDAWDLFSVYFSPHSPDNIGFPSELVVQMRKVLSKDVTKLRTSPPLFMAYGHAYGLLDKNYCPLFHTSDEFYQWLCGPRTPASINLSGASSPSIPGSPAKHGRINRRNESTVSKLSTRLHKIKGALRAPTVDGHPFDTDVLPLDTDTEFGEELEEEEERDLTSYRVRINNADTKLDLVTGKLTPTYIITVQKLGDGGRLEEEWCVERRLADFYSLEGKLTEFHGDFPDTQLPPCGLLAPSPPTNADVYEIYLQKLIANPSLRGSDLLYRFLTPSSLDFGAEDNAFGRLLRKSVPLSLRKERGQNTDHFIATFFQSTDTKKTKSEWKEGSCDVKPRNIRCLTNTVFRDNLGISLYNFPQSPPANGPTVLRVTGPSDALLIFGAKVFKVPNFLLRLALAVHSLLNKGLDSMFCIYIDKKLRSLLVPQRIAHLIHLLHWIVFEKHTKSDPKEVASKVEERISQLSGVKHTFYQTLYKLVQNRILNKQLLYTILDLVLDELFPETASIQ
uniref:RGS domain-containing protein n=1 Tax=Lygus hesperus TaxID=30085 RepID=A0A0K8T8Q8_LYGHE